MRHAGDRGEFAASAGPTAERAREASPRLGLPLSAAAAERQVPHTELTALKQRIRWRKQLREQAVRELRAIRADVLRHFVNQGLEVPEWAVVATIDCLKRVRLNGKHELALRTRLWLVTDSAYCNGDDD